MHLYSLLVPVAVSQSKYRFKFLSAATVVETSSELVIFDTGFPDGEELIKGLQDFGLHPDDFGWVFNTHVHIDHFGGNYRFKNAKKVVSRRDYLFQKRWTEALLKTRNKLSYIERSFPHLPKRDVERLIDFLVVVQKSHFRERYLGDPDTLVWAEDKPAIPDWIRILHTPGHTPYHLSFLVEGGEHSVIIAGDRVPNRGHFFEEQKSFIEVDMDRAEARASELRIRRYAQEGEHSIICPAHDRPFWFRGGGYLETNPHELC
jgi:N-acyl homoserine lactone hydrolase